MFHPFDILTLDNGARLIFTPCPGTRGVSLADSLKSLKEAGAQAVITMMTLAELSENQADALPSLCADLHMDWFHLPVQDSCAPEEPFEQAFAREKKSLLALVRSGGTLVIHCHGGSGRTGMMAAVLMLESGYQPAQVKKQVQLIRPKSLTSPVQVNYLCKRYGYQ
ncbi:TPA: tyrosine-protein phosphatase [Klebsiella michiganensis]|nr:MULTISPECIES: tyrosine-protein phosphatase [Enterobacteriaceae]AUU88926.1 phosphatase [Enterobacteriaceae bacterium ENNIH3]AUV05783.1 phosphatase [Enterobacteriaceae bacterium ENNIH2]ELD7981829.1 tyrosine-protein phosphatase [Enterobacter hormaechei]MDU4295312.1 tyrosine-protein phosphatase [Enterobacter asburiae]HBM3127756.1 tyrosine-protein phosphatase [Klebsiella michiganensis]HCD7315860.1 tyrosine-protein phosphatase [Enterobacter chengduensis]HED1379804.1 tyrosine-protein phosphatase